MWSDPLLHWLITLLPWRAHARSIGFWAKYFLFFTSMLCCLLLDPHKRFAIFYYIHNVTRPWRQWRLSGRDWTHQSFLDFTLSPFFISFLSFLHVVTYVLLVETAENLSALFYLLPWIASPIMGRKKDSELRYWDALTGEGETDRERDRNTERGGGGGRNDQEPCRCVLLHRSIHVLKLHNLFVWYNQLKTCSSHSPPPPTNHQWRVSEAGHRNIKQVLRALSTSWEVHQLCTPSKCLKLRLQMFAMSSSHTNLLSPAVTQTPSMIHDRAFYL